MAAPINLERYYGYVRSFRGAAAALTLVSAVTLCAAVIPISHLDPATSKAFDDYVAAYEKADYARFSSTGKLWVDRQCCNCCGKASAFDEGKPVVEPRESKDVSGGSIHHFSGSIRVKGATLEMVRQIMQDYPNYVKYFKGDLGSAKGEKQADSKPEDEHYLTNLFLVQSTLWIAVTYDSKYDVHYYRLDKNRFIAKSASLSIREQRDPKNAAAGLFPLGEDHGFLWKTNTYWLIRERDGGLDMQVDSMSLSRQSPTGFGWWGTKRTKDAVDKMLRDTRAAIESLK